VPVIINVVPGGSDLSILESEVTLVSASTPGPAGPGVIAGGTTGQRLQKASDTDFDTEWADAIAAAVNAADVAVVDTGAFYTATDVEGVLAEIAPQLGAGASDAADVTFTPAGNIAASDVQAAVEELDTEKAAASHTHAESDVTNLTTDLAGKQPLASDLTAIAGLSPTNDDILQRKAGAWTNRTIAQLLTDLGLGSLYQAKDTTLDTYAGIDPSSNVQSVLGAADYAAIRTLLGLVIGTNVQAYDADLTTYAGISPSANVQSVLGAADYAAIRTLLGLVIGTHVQAYDADLTTWAGLTPSAFFQTLVDDADAATARATLGVIASLFQAGGAQAIKLDDLAAPDDNTDLNVSTAKHGLAPKAPNDATKYLDGTGAYTVPAGGSSTSPDDVSLIVHMEVFA